MTAFPAFRSDLDLEAVATEGPNTSRAFESITADFFAYFGTVAFEMGIEIDNPDRLSAFAQVQGGHKVWTYTFVPDADGELIFEYDRNGPMSLRFESSSDPSEQLFGAGSITRELDAGQQFTMALHLFAGPNCSGVCNGVSTISTGAFRWTIVPEPATAPIPTMPWTLLVGFALALLGAVGRRCF